MSLFDTFVVSIWPCTKCFCARWLRSLPNECITDAQNLLQHLLSKQNMADSANLVQKHPTKFLHAENAAINTLLSQLINALFDTTFCSWDYYMAAIPKWVLAIRVLPPFKQPLSVVPFHRFLHERILWDVFERDWCDQPCSAWREGVAGDSIRDTYSIW